MIKKILLITITALFLTACGGAGTSTSSNGTSSKTETASTKFSAKVGEKDYSFDIKDAVVLNVSLPGMFESKEMQMNQHNIILGSYSFEGQPVRTVPAGQTKVVVTLSSEWAEKGSESVLKPGTYKTSNNGPMTVSNNNIVFIQDGKEVQNYETYGFSGEVKIISVEGDTVKGEIDIKTAKQQCKGTFTAKITKL